MFIFDGTEIGGWPEAPKSSFDVWGRPAPSRSDLMVICSTIDLHLISPKFEVSDAPRARRRW